MSSIMSRIHDMEEEKAERSDVHIRSSVEMQLRDDFFKAALTGLLATPAVEGQHYTTCEIVGMAWKIADVSLEKRK